MSRCSSKGRAASRLQTSRGYTLIELVVVLVIVGILASVALKSLKAVNDTARFEETRQELDNIAHAIAGDPCLISGGSRTDYGYVGDVGGLPLDLNALVANPGGYTTWRGPYISDDFSTDGSSSEFKNDAWGAAYSYTAGITVSSTGGGSPVTRNAANSIGDLLHNSVSVAVTDLDNTPPGPDHLDSVRIVLSHPDGSGSMISRVKNPGSDGYVRFDSVPIGAHSLQIIYLPDNDTISRTVNVNPGQDYYADVHYHTDVWTE